MRDQPPAAVGFAICPADLAYLRKVHARTDPAAYLASFADTIAGLPYLVDNRLERGKVEIFNAREAWKARCAEQRQHDAKR